MDPMTMTDAEYERWLLEQFQRAEEEARAQQAAQQTAAALETQASAGSGGADVPLGGDREIPRGSAGSGGADVSLGRGGPDTPPRGGGLFPADASTMEKIALAGTVGMLGKNLLGRGKTQPAPSPIPSPLPRGGGGSFQSTASQLARQLAALAVARERSSKRRWA